LSSDFGTPGEKLPVSEDELVDREVLSPNHNERTMPIQMVVIHYTEMQDKGFAIERLCDPEAQVSAHYLIGEQGEVVRLVPEEKRAWHAGVAYWRGHKDVNSASIGIELDHPGHKYGYREFNEAQFQALVPLVARIVKRYDIPRANVIGHSDVAPARKIDPGELFPWDRLAEYGLCLPRPQKLERGTQPRGRLVLAVDILIGYERFVHSFDRGARVHAQQVANVLQIIVEHRFGIRAFA